MSFTVQDVLNEVAWLGNDDDNTDFPSDQILKFCNEAQTMISRARPDVLIQADGTLAFPTELTDLTDVVSLDDKWKAALAAWFLFRGFSRDARDVKHQGLAKVHKDAFDAYMENL